jgi:hypothetical protein
MQTFKAFSKDLRCRNFQYELGKSYHESSWIEPCVNGFH